MLLADDEVSGGAPGETADRGAGVRSGPLLRLFRTVGTTLVTQPRSLSWLGPLAWASLIFLLSSMQPSLGGFDLKVLGGLLMNLAHPAAFGILALLMVPLLGRRRLRNGMRWTAMGPVSGLWLVVIVGLYGFTDEIHQSTVKGRDPSLLDVLSDVVGAYFVVRVVLYLGREDATGRGLLRWLGAGFVGSCAAAGLATWVGERLGGGPWPF